MLWTCVLYAVCASACAAPDAPREEAARALIERFSAKDFNARQAAVDELVAMGLDVLPLVRKTQAETDDREVKMRCEMVLRGIAKTFGVDAGDLETPDTNVSLDVSRVTLNVEGGELGEALEEISRQTGNLSPTVTKYHLGRKVTLQVKGAPYWRAMDALAQSAGMQVNEGYGTDALRMDLHPNPRDRADLDGPVAVYLERCTFIHERVKYQRRGQDVEDRRWHMIEIRAYCETRLPVAATEAWATRIVLPDGTNAIPPDQLKDTGRAGRFNNGWSSRFAGTLSLQVPETGRSAGKSVTIEGAVEIEAVTGLQALRIDKVFGGVGNASVGGTAVTLEGASRDGKQVTLTLRVTSDSRVPVIMARSQGLPYGFMLRDANGVWYDKVKSYQWKGKNAAQGGSPRVGQRLDRVRGEPLDGALIIVMDEVPETAGDWALYFAAPAQTHKQAYPFAIKDVPLP